MKYHFHKNHLGHTDAVFGYIMPAIWLLFWLMIKQPENHNELQLFNLIIKHLTGNPWHQRLDLQVWYDSGHYSLRHQEDSLTVITNLVFCFFILGYVQLTSKSAPGEYGYLKDTHIHVHVCIKGASERQYHDAMQICEKRIESDAIPKATTSTKDFAHTSIGHISITTGPQKMTEVLT